MVRVLAILLLLLAGCGGGPDEAALEKDVRERLAQALPPGTVTFGKLERLGSQSDPGAPAGETRRTLYFTAELELLRDFDFGAWDAPGVAGLISALGAGPKGVTGVAAGGNKAGDVLRVNGTALYRREASQWSPVISGSFTPAAVPAYATNAPQGSVQVALDAMRKAIDSVPKDASPGQRAAIEEELRAAMAAIRSRLARATDGYAIAAGPEHGQYLRFAKALADGPGPRIVPLITRGGEENLRLLREGAVTLALAQADAARDAYEGKGPFASEGPYPGLRAVGSLYPEPVHVLVRSDSAIRSVSGLKGRRVAIGQAGSAARSTALHVLDAHGLRMEDIRPTEPAFGDALVLLQRNEVDAVIQVIGVPADSIRAVLGAVSLRVVPLSRAAIDKLVGEQGGYLAYAIAPGTYPTQRQEVRTVATAAVLLAGTALSGTEIATLTRLVFDTRRDLVALGSAQGAQVSAATARRGLAVPVHAAALKVLDDIASREKP